MAGNVIQSSSGSAIQWVQKPDGEKQSGEQYYSSKTNWILDCVGHGRQKGVLSAQKLNGIKKRTQLLNKHITIRKNVIQAVGESAIIFRY